MPQKAVWTVALLSAAAIIAVIAYSRRDGRPDEYMRQQGEILIERTVPSDGKCLRRSDVAMTEFSARMWWDVEADETWPEYCDWLRRRLAADFTAVSVGDSEADFVRHAPGDTDQLRIESVAGGSRLRVHVTLTSHPD